MYSRDFNIDITGYCLIVRWFSFYKNDYKQLLTSAGRVPGLLVTKRCVIKVLQELDYNDVRKIYANKEVRKFLGGIRIEDSFRVTFEEMLTSRLKSFHWLVREQQTKKLIGLVSLDLHHKGIYQEISYQFLPCWWGKGNAGEIMSAILHFTFESLNLSAVVAEIQKINKASCRLLERVGMQ